MACRSSVMRGPWRSIGAELLRTSPPPCPSVVEDASSNCSLPSRRSRRLMPGAGSAVAHQAGNLGLVHRVDHGRRCAGAAEHITDVDDVGDRWRPRRPIPAARRCPEGVRRARRRSLLSGTANRRRPRRHGPPQSRQPFRHAIVRSVGSGGVQIARSNQNAARGVRVPLERLYRPPERVAVRTFMDKLAILWSPLHGLDRDRHRTTASAKLTNPRGIQRKLSRFFGVKVTNRKPYCDNHSLCLRCDNGCCERRHFSGMNLGIIHRA